MYQNKSYLGNINEYVKLTNFTINTINDKIRNIQIHSKNRKKRGIINGLGNVIKFVTGNLDADDEKRYDSLINHIETNQINLQDQIRKQYSISSTLIKNFNNTLQDIQYNGNELKSKIIDISKSLTNVIVVQKIKETLIQIQNLLQIILIIFEEIENSLTFCKLKTLHPSIISTDELYQEIVKVSKYYKNKLPLTVDNENILDYEQILSITCKITPTKIIYFISLPIVDEEDYELYNLYSVPFKINNTYATTIPTVNYVLKSVNNVIRFVRNNCKGNKINICSYDNIFHQDTSCEKTILLHQHPSNCTIVNLQISSNFVEHVPHTNKYLAVFPHGETIKIKNNNGLVSRALQGIFLITLEDETLIFKNEELSPISHTRGKLHIMENFNFKFQLDSNPKMTIHLKKLTLQDIPANTWIPSRAEEANHFLAANLWTIILYSICLLVTVIYLIKIYIKCKNNRTTNTNTTPNTTVGTQNTQTDSQNSQTTIRYL